MKKISNKQQRRNRELSAIKAQLPKVCVICGRYGNDLAHILPKSLYPEYYTDKRNLVIMCRNHHNEFELFQRAKLQKTQVDDKTNRYK